MRELHAGYAQRLDQIEQVIEDAVALLGPVEYELQGIALAMARAGNAELELRARSLLDHLHVGEDLDR
jgi:hypothetical protein